MVCMPSLTSKPGWADLEASLPGIATECSGIRLTGSATLIRPGQDSHWKANGYKIQTSAPTPIEALLGAKEYQRIVVRHNSELGPLEIAMPHR